MHLCPIDHNMLGIYDSCMNNVNDSMLVHSLMHLSSTLCI